MIEYDTIVEGEVTQQTIEGQANTYPNETDPTVPKHVKDITKEDIEKWNKGGTGGGGNSGVYVGEDEPPSDVNVWIDPTGEADEIIETDPTVPNYVKDITEEDINKWNNVDGLDNVLRDILNAIQSGVSASMTIEEIEQIIVSYFENKTVEEVEE